MPIKRIAAFLLLFAASVCPLCFAADGQKSDGAAAQAEKELTKEEMSKNVSDSLDRMPDIMGLLPGLKKESGADGKEAYTYNGVKLEDLSKEELAKISVKVNSEAVRIRTDRLNKQLADIRRIEQMNRQNRQIASASRGPTNTPKVYLPPKVPKTYKSY